MTEGALVRACGLLTVKTPGAEVNQANGKDLFSGQ